VTGRSARNQLLAAASCFAVYAAILQLVGATSTLSDVLGFPGYPGFKVAYGFGVLASLVAVAAFGVAAAAFLRAARPARTKALAVSAALFAGYALVQVVSGVIFAIEAGLNSPWAPIASNIAAPAGHAALVIAAVLAAIALGRRPRDRFLGFACLALSGYLGLLAAEAAFQVVAYGEFGQRPGEVTAGLATAAVGYAVTAAAALIAAAAFIGAAGRRRAGEPWNARRDGALGSAARVLAAGFLVAAIGGMVFAGSQFARTVPGDAWLKNAYVLGLSLAAACGAIAFRPGLEDRDRPDLGALADPR
jgi:hypothetical protein